MYVKYPLLTLGEIWRLIRRTLYLNIPKKYYFLPSMFCFHLILTVFVFSSKNGINTRTKKCNYFHLKTDFLCFSKKIHVFWFFLFFLSFKIGLRTPPSYQTKYGLCLSERCRLPNLQKKMKLMFFYELKTNTIMSHLRGRP